MDKELNKLSDFKELGKVKGIKEVSQKYTSTIISDTLEASDVYVDVKKIIIPKSKLRLDGVNGLDVPKEYFPKKEADLSNERIVEYFKSCDSFTFNMSQRDSSSPVTCIANFSNEFSIFINLHELMEAFNISKLCEDRSTFKLGNESYYLPKSSLKELIDSCLELYSIYHSESSNEYDLQNFFKQSTELGFFEKAVYWFFKNFSFSETNFTPISSSLDRDLQFYFLKNKKINVINVYP
jgi:hypothetical protein